MLPVVTIEGRVVADPELRFAPSGVAVGSFRMVAASRKKNEAGEWVDDKTLWMKVTCFKQLAENVAESLCKGDLVVVTGRLQTEEWEKDGEKRSATVMVADTVSASLAFRTVPRSEETRGERAPAAAPAVDPWSGGASTEEPPF